MRAVRTHAHENREPATTRWVRAAGADIARFGEARPLGPTLRLFSKQPLTGPWRTR